MDTERLTIRLLRQADWRDLQKIAMDFRKSEYSVYDMPLPLEDEKIKKITCAFSESKLFYAVFLKKIMIGYICFHNNGGIYDIGYCFLSAFQHQGYAFESCCAVLKEVEKSHHVKRFTAGSALKNIPSLKLLGKLGFVLKKTETLSFCKDKNGNDIVFEGGVFEKCVG